MLISLDSICADFGISGCGVLHVGAHLAEEREAYRRCDFRKVIWVEANPRLAGALADRICSEPAGFEAERVLNAAVHERDGVWVDFHITNNLQSSSVLELGTHRVSHPDIHVVETLKVQTVRLETLFNSNPGLADGLEFANLDIQGVEFEALRGMGDFLSRFKWIYTEVNTGDVYKGNATLWEIDRLLLGASFIRKRCALTSSCWGDAFYVRDAQLGLVSRFLRYGTSYLAQSLYSVRQWLRRLRFVRNR